MLTNAAVTLCQSRREDGFRVEVKRRHFTALHRTAAYGTSAESWEAAYLWMRENGFAPGPYRVEPDAEEERGTWATPAGLSGVARGVPALQAG
jgi:hypothetical protein